MSDTVTFIGESAFDGCVSLTDINLPNSLKAIYDNAFYFCTGLKSVDLPDSLDTLGVTVFNNCKGLESINVGENNPSFMSVDGVLYNKDEQIYYNVERLETAVREHKKASFFYFDLNENCEKVFRKNKQRYVVEPMALIFNEDNYYLMCYSSKYDNICNYRIDRMEQVEVTDEIVSDKAVISNDDVSVYTKQIFKMYGGTVQKLTLTFDKSLIGAVHDKFGEKIEMIKINDALFSTEVTVQNSPTFNGWINQFGDKIKLSGKEKIKLETYVQTTYFERIIFRANQRLRVMSNDQYELVRREEASNFQRQSGLDLDVKDYYNGSVRDVKSLSGGESFLASLSLALGLSDEVQSSSGGIRLDTMFIDEGFGSLDGETLELAFKALMSLSNDNKLIGIISHVDALKTKIDKQIIISKDKVGGSKAKIVLQ